MKLEDYSDLLRDWLINHGVFGDKLYAIHLLAGIVLLASICVIIWWLARIIIITVVRRAVTKSKTNWDDKLFEYKVFRTLALILIAFILVEAMPVVLRDFPVTGKFALIIAKIYVVLSIMFSVNAILNAIVGIMEKTDRYKDKPLRSYKQVTKIVFYLIGFVMILAIVLNQSPLYIFTGFGAVTAILLLIFRDPILGFVASVQMSAIDLIRIGDWITVEKYGADGEVMEINLTTIKVRNWDMTVTIVPSYAIVSESFKNWRGMEESEGRRIKRHINIKISSIRYCDESLYNRLLKIERIREHLSERQLSIETYNKENNIDTSIIINGRQMTNIGIFRLYAEKYLEGNPLINKDMTFMVRQLQPNENGLPIEVYAFSIEKGLERFEAVAADIFDHLLAAVPYFELEIFQNPSGSDMRARLRNEDSSTPWHEDL